MKRTCKYCAHENSFDPEVVEAALFLGQPFLWRCNSCGMRDWWSTFERESYLNLNTVFPREEEDFVQTTFELDVINANS